MILHKLKVERVSHKFCTSTNAAFANPGRSSWGPHALHLSISMGFVTFFTPKDAAPDLAGSISL